MLVSMSEKPGFVDSLAPALGPHFIEAEVTVCNLAR